ncbi:MAG TPA: Uma2 family endonuclease [Thermoanaerobaculia bacterium]|nr:Uma2 family endonuclease [Thermoanaerobaculia bacterium]
MATIPLRHDIDYPESDGQPTGETEFHRDEMFDLIAALKDQFLEIADVYVAGNLFLYYVEGDRRAVVCPDVFLVKGVPKQPKRRIYKLWEEGHAPSLVIEVTSLHTRAEDQKDKKKVYERLGVEEYFLHDPFGEYLSPVLQGFRLVEGRYRPLSPSPDGSLISNVTGLRLRPEGQRLRLLDLATGEPLLWDEEVREQARRAARAEDALRAAEEEVAQLRRKLEDLKPS